MEFRTVVDLPGCPFELSPTSRVLLLGSCFAEGVGRRMADAMPPGCVDVNPFGVLYNPESIRRALDLLLNGSLFFPDEYLFRGQDGLVHSWMHSGAFSRPTLEACAAAIKARYEPAARQLRCADLIVVTFGTSHAYLHKREGYVVSNCHKAAASTFQEQSLTLEEIVDRWDALLDELACEVPTARVLFTVSPYRYLKYGLHGSNLAKATLLLAIDRLCLGHKNACYFPAYEIIVDELRDYRFYEADMSHPSAQATDYVWERFRQWAFSSRLQAFAMEQEALRRAEAHRTLHPESPESRAFQDKLKKKKDAFRRKWHITA